MKQRREKITIGSKFGVTTARYNVGPIAATGELPGIVGCCPLQRLEKHPEITTTYYNGLFLTTASYCPLLLAATSKGGLF